MVRKLRVFDFDDTLAKTGSRINVKHGDDTETTMTPGEYAKYVPRPGDVFDYSEFERLIDPQEIRIMTNVLRNVTRVRGPEGAVVLTARHDPGPVREFLRLFGLPQIDIEALGSGDPMAKAEYIARRIEDEDLTHVEFFDDSEKNVAAVATLRDVYPEVDIISRLIRYGTNEEVEVAKPYGLLVLKRYIQEVVRASPEYMEKEDVRQGIQDQVAAMVASGEISGQEDLDGFFASMDTGDETVAMAVNALKMVPLEVWHSMPTR